MKEPVQPLETAEPTSNVAVLQERAQQPFVPPQFSTATDADVLAYLRHTGKMGEIATLAEQDIWARSACDQLGITVSDDEWQAAGDAFRLEHKLLGSTETFAWMTQQRTTVEAWSEGIKTKLLTQKLKDHLLGASVDSAYISDRDHYRRVALSQILVTELSTALTIVQKLRDENASFCTLALTHSRGKQSQESGGFVGIRFLVELLPQIVQAIGAAKEGEVIGPIQTTLGYHVLRVEKWFPAELNESVRTQILDSLFQVWLQGFRNTNGNGNGHGT